MYNLLTDQLIRFETAYGLEKGSLPDVYAALMRDDIKSFPAMRAHQESAWHMFLAQLGAIAAHRGGLTTPPEDAGTWRTLIGNLTRSEFPNDEPWCLIVEDCSKPAFLQPPVPDEVNWTAQTLTPDALDMLSLSKNHDLKQNTAYASDIDDWLFALVTQQTFDGSLTDNPKSLQLSIARMNSGLGSRAFFGFAPIPQNHKEPSWGSHIHHDIVILLETYNDWPDEWKLLFQSSLETIALTWLPQWSSPDSIEFKKLDPLFIEVCRVIRLSQSYGNILGQRAGSRGRRVDSSETKGETGDPWAPVNIAKQSRSVLTFSHSTVNYSSLSQILFDESKYLHPICLGSSRIKQQSHKNFVIVVRGISRKQGHQTERFAKRLIPLGKLSPRQLLGSMRPQIHELANEQIQEIKKIDDTLTSSIGIIGRCGVFLKDIPSKQRRKADDKQRDQARPYRERFDTVADRLFFPALWARFEAQQIGTAKDAEQARRDFLLPLIGAARDLLEEGIADVPCALIRRPRAAARARRTFEGRVRSKEHGFPALFANDHPEFAETSDAA